MENKDIRLLASIPGRVIAEEIQRLLEASGIYTVLVSDNPASSVLNAHMGSYPMETIHIRINSKEYQQAIEILANGPYEELVNKE